MNNEIIKDIFISYKTGGSGSNFGSRLSQKLESLGYTVSFNPHEKKSDDFRKRLKQAVIECTDFILILNDKCLKQLSKNNPEDYIKFEILTAKEHGKNIIPLYLDKLNLSNWTGRLPQELNFILYIDGIPVYDEELYYISTLDRILSEEKGLKSKPEQKSIYMYAANGNADFNAKDDFDKLLVKALSGDVESMYYVACYYHHGFVGTINHAESSTWLKKIADTNQEPFCSFAHSMLADYYYRGTMPGEEQSYIKAFEHRELATQDGKAQMERVAMQKIGSGCVFDFEKIEHDFEKSTQKDSIGIEEKAKFYISYGNFEKAMEIYNSTDCLLPESEYQLGLLYKKGVHTTPPCPDYILAGYHFERAADAGHTNATYELGMLNFNPTGKYKKDFKRAEKYFKIAADAGIAEAQYKLGWIYQNGLNGNKNISESIKYNTLAANQGHIGAAGSLCLLYQEPGYINYQKAYEYAKQAADAGYGNGALRLANFLMLGRGCKANEAEAIKYYQMALDKGITQAKFMLKRIEDLKHSHSEENQK